MNTAKPTQGAIIAAYAVAILCDLIQLPFTLGSMTVIFTGPVEIADFGFDVIVMALLSFLLGFQMALVPAMLLEFVPFLDLLPIWTAIVFFIRWRQKRAAVPPVPPAQPPVIPAPPRSRKPTGPVIDAEIVMSIKVPPLLPSSTVPKR